jgi:predicted GIY-YIG superfamily endonuclease
MPKHPLPAPGPMGVVYLLHLAIPIAHSQHYVGWSKAVSARCHHHLNGTGSKFLAAANERGISYEVVRTWEPADHRFERYVKNYSQAPLLCPICNPLSWATRIPEVTTTPPRGPRPGWKKGPKP